MLKNAEELRSLAVELEPYVVECRRRVHRLAELSGEEVQTAAFIEGELDDMGVAWSNPTPTSVLGVLESGRPGRCVALRADIDALPIVESPENLAGSRTCVSENPTTCHACGHDGHTAMLLGTSHALSRLRDEGCLDGTVLLCFESAEETMSGYEPMLKALESYPVEAVWGMHLYADLESGKICVDAGPRMAGAAALDVVLHGTGGHGSRPDMARNPVFAAANLLNNLAVAWVNQLAPDESVTLGATTIEGGGRFNIIPEEARIKGSLRYFNGEAGKKALEIVRHVSEHTAAMYGCEADVSGSQELCRPVVNDGAASTLATEALREVLPDSAVIPFDPWFGSESFGFYLGRYPGVFAHLGIANPEYGSGSPHHTPRFDVDEGVLKLGVMATLAYACAYLEHGFEA